jgi:hypothetical protein
LRRRRARSHRRRRRRRRRRACPHASAHGRFLLDFCYYCNLLLLAQLWIWPNEPRLFIVVFCAVNGPLAWAVILFRNSLVFHSIGARRRLASARSLCAHHSLSRARPQTR